VLDISFAQSHLAIDPLGRAIYPVEGPSHDNQTIEVLTANSDGTLTHLQDFEVGPYVRSLSFTPDGTVSFGTECSRFGPFLDLLKRSSDGTLSWDTDFYGAATQSQLQHPKSCPIAASISPNGNYFAMVGIISQTYTPIDNVLEIISSVPNVAELKGSPYSIGLIGISDVTWHPSGEFLAVGAQNGVSIYRFQAGSTPELIDGSPFGSDPIDRVKFNQAGTLLFAISSKSQRLYVFRFREGKLIPAPGSPYGLSIVPFNLAVVN
jgi:WD40 repeat protein